MSALKAVARLAPFRVSYTQVAASATAPDAYLFVNPTGSGEYFELVELAYNYSVLGGSGAVADLKVAPSGTALASGTSALVSTLDLTATANIPRKGVLSGTKAKLLIKPGDSLAIDTGGTLTGLAGLVINVLIRPISVKAVK